LVKFYLSISEVSLGGYQGKNFESINPFLVWIAGNSGKEKENPTLKGRNKFLMIVRAMKGTL